MLTIRKQHLKSRFKLSSLINKSGGIKNLLRKYFDEEESSHRRYSVSKSEIHLYRMIKLMFKDTEVNDIMLKGNRFVQVRFDFHHKDMLYKHSKKTMKLDIFLPSFSL